MSASGQRLFDPALLFRTQLQPVRTQLKFGATGWQLPPEAELPGLGVSVSGQDSFAHMRLAVSDTGLFISADVSGKRKLPWCRESRLEDSDGLHVWIDTRNSRDVHRATRFCHRFLFAPLGRGAKNEQPFASWVPINRARENSNPPAEKQLTVEAQRDNANYSIQAALAWKGLTGFDRQDFPVIGFYIAVTDTELGVQTLGLSLRYPVAEDPSLWLELDLSQS